ncbi:MAG TPA: hypothetical protein VJC18_00695, partial [bacterium]|nr:hypothetical protein [bacterium]
MTEADSDACHLLESAAQLLHDDETHSKTEKLLALSSVLLVENRRVRTFDGYTDLLSRLNKQLRRLGIEKKKNEHVTALSGEFFVDENVGRLSAMLVKREGRFDGVVVIPDLNWEVRFSLVPNGRAGQYIVDDSQPVSVTSLTTRRVVAAGISLERNEDNTSEFNLVFRGETAISVFIMGTESRVERGVYPVFHEINTNADSKLILDALVTRSAKIIAPDMRVIMGRLLSRNSLAAGTGFTAQYRLLCANGDVITVSQKVDQSGVRIKKIEASALWHDLHLGTVSTMTVTQKGNALVLTGGGSNQEIIIPLTTAQTRMASHLLDLDKIEMRRRG